MKIFIAGATGYTGRALVCHGAELGDEIVAHVRPSSSQLAEAERAFAALGAEVLIAPWELDALSEALRRHRPEAIFCLIGTTKARMRALEAEGGRAAEASYEAVDFGLTRLLVEAAEAAIIERGAEGQTGAAGWAPKFIYLSSLGAGPDARGAYLRARWRAEQAVTSSSLPFAIARPGFISGPDRRESRPMERLGARLTDALLKPLGALGLARLERAYSSITAEQLARALRRAAQLPGEDLVIESAELKELAR